MKAERKRIKKKFTMAEKKQKETLESKIFGTGISYKAAEKITEAEKQKKSSFLVGIALIILMGTLVYTGLNFDPTPTGLPTINPINWENYNFLVGSVFQYKTVEGKTRYMEIKDYKFDNEGNALYTIDTFNEYGRAGRDT